MRRVVVTGIGLITPVGLGWRASWAALIAGRSGIAPVRSFDTSQLPAHIGAEVKDFSPEPCVRRQPAAALGESLGAAGAMGALVAALALQKRCLPPTAGVNEPGLEELRLSGQPQPIHGDYALINGFSCDGNNAAMVLGRWSE